MIKYAIAVCVNATNKVVFAEANSPVEALKIGIEENIEFDQYDTVEEAISYYFDGDIIVSVPVEV